MFLITCFEFFFCSSHDLLEIVRLVLDQFNLFFFLEFVQYADVESNGSGEKEQLPGQL